MANASPLIGAGIATAQLRRARVAGSFVDLLRNDGSMGSHLGNERHLNTTGAVLMVLQPARRISPLGVLGLGVLGFVSAVALYVWISREAPIVGLPPEVAMRRAACSKISPGQALKLAQAEWARLMQNMEEEERGISEYPPPRSGYLFVDSGDYVIVAGAFRKHGWGFRGAYIVNATDGSVRYESSVLCKPDNIVFSKEE